eukprot:EG_transcript_24856
MRVGACVARAPLRRTAAGPLAAWLGVAGAVRWVGTAGPARPAWTAERVQELQKQNERLYRRWKAGQLTELREEYDLIHAGNNCDRWTYTWVFSGCETEAEVATYYRNYLEHSEGKRGFRYWFVYVASSMNPALQEHLGRLTLEWCEPHAGRPEVKAVDGPLLYTRMKAYYEQAMAKVALEGKQAPKPRKPRTPSTRTTPRRRSNKANRAEP